MDYNYRTELGKAYQGEFEKIIKKLGLKNKAQLVITSPPFPLNKKKKYGNMNGEEYLSWIESLAPLFSYLLKDDGSLVIEIGNAWEKGRPIQSLLTTKALLSLVENKDTSFKLCQEFICHNPARLPSPAQWVTIERIRAVDSFTHIWWLSKSDYPKADNMRILRPYSKSMRKIHKNQKYNDGKRPSQHIISKDSFLNNNEGSISHNVIQMNDEDVEIRFPYSMQSYSNTNSKDYYLLKCKELGIKPHPARMPGELATFFINFLTDEGDLVVDPFAGSNTVGYASQLLNRRWVAIDTNADYLYQSTFRFEGAGIDIKLGRELTFKKDV